MTVKEIIKDLELTVYTAEETAENRIVNGCYIGDLLSLAMARVDYNNVWVTIQTNINIVAVASLADAACIIIADGFVPDKNTIEKAKEQDIIILSSALTAYEVAAKLSALGI
jgi:serine kinase of HPr protein (carbohydrate metabolism regulator)